MNLFNHLKNEHQRQRTLLQKLVETSGDSAERNELFSKLKMELERHAIAEEHVLYSRMMASDGRDDAVHSVAEHKEMRDLVEELSTTDTSSSAWLPKMKHLSDRVLHHIDEEERDTFPKAKEGLNEQQISDLAMAYKRRSTEAAQEISSAR